MKYFLSGTWVNDATISKLPVGAVALTDAKWENRNSIPYVPTLAEVRANKLKYINAEADKRFEVMLDSYPRHEVNTWSNQYAEAKAFKLDPLALTPTLTALALNYGKTVSVLAQNVLDKAAAYTTATGEIIGKRKKLTDQVVAATTTTVAQIEAILWI